MNKIIKFLFGDDETPDKPKKYIKYPKLKTLEDHNNNRRQIIFDLLKPQPNGIACPECGNELYDTEPMKILTSYPAQKNIHCTCGYSGFRIA